MFFKKEKKKKKGSFSKLPVTCLKDFADEDTKLWLGLIAKTNNLNEQTKGGLVFFFFSVIVFMSVVGYR